MCLESDDERWKLSFLLIDIYFITCYTRDPVCISPPTFAAARAACISPPTDTVDKDAPPVPGVLSRPPHVSVLVAGARRVCYPRVAYRSRAFEGRTCVVGYTRPRMLHLHLFLKLRTFFLKSEHTSRPF